jgi:hypothetical protein
VNLLVQLLYTIADPPNQYFSNTPHSRKTQGLTYREVIPIIVALLAAMALLAGFLRNAKKKTGRKHF